MKPRFKPWVKESQLPEELKRIESEKIKFSKDRMTPSKIRAMKSKGISFLILNGYAAVVKKEGKVYIAFRYTDQITDCGCKLNGNYYGHVKDHPVLFAFEGTRQKYRGCQCMLQVNGEVAIYSTWTRKEVVYKSIWDVMFDNGGWSKHKYFFPVRPQPDEIDGEDITDQYCLKRIYTPNYRQKRAKKEKKDRAAEEANTKKGMDLLRNIGFL